MFRFAAICLLALLAGCDSEAIRRNGRPGDAGYIAPDYRPVKMIAFEPELIEEVGGRVAKRQAYSVVEDDRGRRYRVIGRAGEVGDEFQMDVSLLTEFGS